MVKKIPTALLTAHQALAADLMDCIHQANRGPHFLVAMAAANVLGGMGIEVEAFNLPISHRGGLIGAAYLRVQGLRIDAHGNTDRRAIGRAAMDRHGYPGRPWKWLGKPDTENPMDVSTESQSNMTSGMTGELLRLSALAEAWAGAAQIQADTPATGQDGIRGPARRRL